MPSGLSDSGNYVELKHFKGRALLRKSVNYFEENVVNSQSQIF